METGQLVWIGAMSIAAVFAVFDGFFKQKREQKRLNEKHAEIERLKQENMELQMVLKGLQSKPFRKYTHFANQDGTIEEVDKPHL